TRTRNDGKIVERHIQCPKCPSSDAYCIYEDGQGHCYSCNYHYFPNDTDDWVLTNPSNTISTYGISKAIKDKGILIKDITDNMDTVYTYEYLPFRGISKETFRFYNSLTKIDSEGKPKEIGFPYPNGSVKVRTLSTKGFYSKGDIGKAGLFGRDKFTAGSHKTLIITEGEIDALSTHQVVRCPVVSVHSASSTRTDVSVDRSWCNTFEKIVLAFDGDEA